MQPLSIPYHSPKSASSKLPGHSSLFEVAHYEIGLAFKLWWTYSKTLSDPSSSSVVFKWVFNNLAAKIMNKMDKINGNNNINKFNILLNPDPSSSS